MAVALVFVLAVTTTYYVLQFSGKVTSPVTVTGAGSASRTSSIRSTQSTLSSVTVGTCGSLCSSFTPHSIGYIGCSISEISVSGYDNYSANRGLFWAPYSTGGGLISGWDNPNSQYWLNFDAELTTYGQPKAVWVQICVSTTANFTYNDVVTAVQILRSKVPNAALFFSPLVTYPLNWNCTFANVPQSYTFADEAASNGLGVRGPNLGPWTASDMGSATCDPGTAGARTLVGTQLSSYFG